MYSPKPGRRLTQLAILIFLLTLAPSLAKGVSAQPGSGSDPCSRALANLGIPATVATPDRAVNRQIITQTVMNFASCFNRHNWDGVIALTDPEFRQSLIGAAADAETRDRLDALDARGLLPQIRIQSIEESGAFATRFASLAVTWQGWNGLHRELWRLQSTDSGWVLSGRTIDRPQISGAAVGIQLTIDDDELISPRAEVVNPGSIILAFDNRRADLVTALVLAAPQNATAAEIIALCNDPGAQLEPVGWISAEPGSIAYLPLMDLLPGRYAVLTGHDPCMAETPFPIGQVVLVDISE